MFCRLRTESLQSYYGKFKETAVEVENIKEKITSLGCSADSRSKLEEKNKELKKLRNQLKEVMRLKLKDWSEIKDDLQEVFVQCEQVKVTVIFVKRVVKHMHTNNYIH